MGSDCCAFLLPAHGRLLFSAGKLLLDIKALKISASGVLPDNDVHYHLMDGLLLPHSRCEGACECRCDDDQCVDFHYRQHQQLWSVVETFLSLNFNVSGLPKASYMRAYDLWVIACMAFTFFALCELAFASLLDTWMQKYVIPIHREKSALAPKCEIRST